MSLEGQHRKSQCFAVLCPRFLWGCHRRVPGGGPSGAGGEAEQCRFYRVRAVLCVRMTARRCLRSKHRGEEAWVGEVDPTAQRLPAPPSPAEPRGNKTLAKIMRANGSLVAQRRPEWGRLVEGGALSRGVIRPWTFPEAPLQAGSPHHFRRSGRILPSGLPSRLETSVAQRCLREAQGRRWARRGWAAGSLPWEAR